ncbi:MAG TPA: CxxxxCH/CxxCH domain-containing protein, partial [Labilithrix sp.]
AGALACGTCHGDGASRASPPRDPCFHPNEGGAHLAHTAPTAARANGLACATCHPSPDPANPIAGAHANGVVDVIAEVAWDGATCSNTCHTRPGGSKGRVAWSDTTPLGCGSCHGAPPPVHFAGACSSCHREANADGTALANPVLHVNGKVDLGDGSGACGACHGTGASPWPKTNAHATHMAPDSAASVPCESCHEVPTSFGAGTAHPRGGPAVVTFSGRATIGGAKPTYVSGSCASTYCHGAATPKWADASGAGKACGSCHGLPPPAPHVGSTTCEQCHSPVVRSTPSGPAIDPAFASRHVDGNIDRGP